MFSVEEGVTYSIASDCGGPDGGGPDGGGPPPQPPAGPPLLLVHSVPGSEPSSTPEQNYSNT